MKRVSSVDFARGFVMIIMALDHVRDMIHANSITQSPTNLATTSPILFFTRWITYLCAPIFVFLAGTSAYLSFKKKEDVSQSRSFLLKRGVYLILLELSVVNFALYFDVGFHTFIFEVIAAIGFGFVILGLSLKLPARIIGFIGLVIIFCHNLFPLIPFTGNSSMKAVLNPLFTVSVFSIFSNKVFIVAYPPIPWTGIMMMGFAFGKLFQLPEEKKKLVFVKIAVGAILLFVMLRFINIYGDPAPWSSQKNALFTFLSFMNVTKYPPSLLFCLITLGIMFLILAFGETKRNKFTQILSVYGKVPLFYFVAHFFLVHLIMLATMLFQGFHWPQLDFASGSFGRPKGLNSGLSLRYIYLIWICVVVVLYKPCQWFGKFKAEHTYWWLKYM